MNFQESWPKDDHHISFKEKKQMPKNFGEQHKEVKRLEQNKTRFVPTNFQPICACVKD